MSKKWVTDQKSCMGYKQRVHANPPLLTFSPQFQVTTHPINRYPIYLDQPSHALPCLDLGPPIQPSPPGIVVGPPLRLLQLRRVENPSQRRILQNSSRLIHKFHSRLALKLRRLHPAKSELKDGTMTQLISSTNHSLSGADSLPEGPSRMRILHLAILAGSRYDSPTLESNRPTGILAARALPTDDHSLKTEIKQAITSRTFEISARLAFPSSADSLLRCRTPRSPDATPRQGFSEW